MDHGIGVVSRPITCCPPMSCARRRTINHNRLTQDDIKDEKATPALSAGGGEPPATQTQFLKLGRVSEATTSSTRSARNA